MANLVAVDIRAAQEWCFCPMRRLRSIIAIALLVIWLPATLHCELEWSGVFGDCYGCHELGDTSGQDTDADGCAIVEGGAFGLSGSVLVKVPDAGWSLVFAALVAPTPETLVDRPNDLTAGPADVVRVWQFVERAAPPCRAPALA